MERKEYEALSDLIEVAKDCGLQFYLVGGCVRNNLLGLYIKDYDIATPHSPAELISWLGPEAKLIESAQAYPVVSFKGLEIASFRKDGVNRADANGISLNATMEEDAMRRDFTVNALYAPLNYNNLYKLWEDLSEPQELDFIDPTGLGKKDLDKDIIRLIGNPEDRLAEDPLRALRAYRFTATLPWFKMEPETKAAVDKILSEVRMKV